MTYPITPNPAIHRSTSADVAKQRQINVTQMQALGQQLMQGVANSLLSILTGGLITPPNSSQSQAAVAALRTLWANIQTDLATLQSDAEASAAAFGTFLQALLTAVTNDTGNWTALIADFQSAWDTYTTTETGLASNEIATIQQIINSLLGINTTTGKMNASNVSNVLGGSSLGADVSSVSSWSTRLTNDLLVTSDVFHLTYAAGTPTDPPGTLSGGKPTWYSAWNDLLALTGLVNSVTPPTDPAPTVGVAVTAAGTLAQGGLDAVNQGITGAAAAGATPAVVQDAAAGLAATLAQVQSNVNSLQNAGDAEVGGVQIVDDGPGTNATGAGWGSNWTLNGGSNANLHLGFQCLGGDAIGSYTGQSLNTDNMVAGIIFVSLPQYNWLGDPADGARHRVKIRESPDRSSCVFADIWHDKVQLGYRKANVDTYIGSATSVTPAAGSNWELYGGNAAGTTPYLFQLVQNGVMASPIAQWNDTGHLSNTGSGYRGSGQDMYSDGTYNPGRTKFHARDLIQPLLKTMMAQHRNTVSTVSSLAGGAIYQLPVGWFNSQIYLMPGVTMATSKAGYIVADEGLYEFSFAIELTSGITGTPYIIAPVIWVNSAPYVEGQSVYSQNGLVSGYSAQITMSVYLFANDTIYPALDTRSQQWTVAGESSGTLSWMQLAKVG